MTKKIDEILRESLLEVENSKENTGTSDEKNNGDKQWSEMSDEEREEVETLRKKIYNAVKDEKLLKLSRVMQVAGVGDADDASDRSLFSKKISGKPDADGVVRYLTKKEATAMSKVVDNPPAYN